jgi:hypothetical protein
MPSESDVDTALKNAKVIKKKPAVKKVAKKK